MKFLTFFPIRRIALWVVLGLAIASAVQAAPQGGGRESSRAAISPDEAAAIVQRRTGGDVLKVERGGRQGQPSYRVRIYLRDRGLVREFNVDATSGRVME